MFAKFHSLIIKCKVCCLAPALVICPTFVSSTRIRGKPGLVAQKFCPHDFVFLTAYVNLPWYMEEKTYVSGIFFEGSRIHFTLICLDYEWTAPGLPISRAWSGQFRKAAGFGVTPKQLSTPCRRPTYSKEYSCGSFFGSNFCCVL